ncbi:hypothetical protein ACRALDRAFT_2046548 [Sodiomyces alcalophilus JCM 7366]|uniref:uncharacterized protein n=1 Tax=Sodiomyces alcalophilus JCM 7366 TaxID=591952 RepID=UPI0039B61A18
MLIVHIWRPACYPSRRDNRENDIHFDDFLLQQAYSLFFWIYPVQRDKLPQNYSVQQGITMYRYFGTCHFHQPPLLTSPSSGPAARLVGNVTLLETSTIVATLDPFFRSVNIRQMMRRTSALFLFSSPCHFAIIKKSPKLPNVNRRIVRASIDCESRSSLYNRFPTKNEYEGVDDRPYNVLLSPDCHERTDNALSGKRHRCRGTISLSPTSAFLGAVTLNFVAHVVGLSSLLASNFVLDVSWYSPTSRPSQSNITSPFPRNETRPYLALVVPRFFFFLLFAHQLSPLLPTLRQSKKTLLNPSHRVCQESSNVLSTSPYSHRIDGRGGAGPRHTANSEVVHLHVARALLLHDRCCTQPLDSGYDPSDHNSAGPPKTFRKRKPLPHPSKHRDQGQSASGDQTSPASGQDHPFDDTASTVRAGLQQSTSSASRSRRARDGPAMPPTPPTHSRTSSSSHSIQLSSPTLPGTPSRSEEKVHARVDRPATPPNPTSPPTPDETPPLQHSDPRALRSVTKSTPGSRAESFRTAREDPYSSAGEDDSRLTIRPNMPSGSASQSSVCPDTQAKQSPLPFRLGNGAGTTAEGDLTPTTRGEFITFDTESSSSREDEPDLDADLGFPMIARNVQAAPEERRTRPAAADASRQRRPRILEDNVVATSNAAEALRSKPLRHSAAARQTPRDPSLRDTSRVQSSTPDARTVPDDRRHSGVSSKSNISTVVEVILVDTGTPQRPQTLRHVKKRETLRDPGTSLSPRNPSPSPLARPEEETRRSRPRTRLSNGRHESYASSVTYNSIASSKARREIWKSGGIPVVVVPNRRSSMHPPKPPSLRSTSSRRTNRSVSDGSVSRMKGSTSDDATPLFTRPPRRARALSESDRSDRRTMDYPPVIPARSSSLSAPTSRNNSRAGSMTAESFKAWNDGPYPAQAQEPEAPPSDALHTMLAVDSGQEDHELHPIDSHDKSDVDHYNPSAGKKFSRKNTPFSVTSLDTNGTAPEVSEALAVSIFSHQNSSILMVDHSSKPSESSDFSQKDKTTEGTPERPDMTATAPDTGDPVTPPQSYFPSNDVDSPLKNPRSPPPPPAIQFIPATPSGLTPYDERHEKLGNYFDEDIDEPKPRRSTSLVRRAFSRRQRSESCPPATTSRSGLLTRTFSLSRNTRRGLEAAREKRKTPAHAYPTVEDSPVEENKLHPFWQPTYKDYDDDWTPSAGDEDRVYRYPPVDNRPRRSLSSRMRRTFAILPLDDGDDYYSQSLRPGTDRRTVRRTPSGNLRVMKRRASSSQSLRQRMESKRLSSAADDDNRPQYSSGPERSGDQTASPGRRRRFSISHTVGELQELPRRMSERRREKRTQELRQKISRPREVRDNIGDVIGRASYRDAPQQTNLSISHR